MPDPQSPSEYPPIAGLKNLQRNLRNPGADEGSPVALRALAALSKQYPADTVGTRVKDMPLDSKYAFSSRLASTPSQAVNTALELPGSDPNTITLNPALSMSWPQPMVEQTMAHELEHIRQNRANLDPLKALSEYTMPYEEQPSEQSAFKAGDAYAKLHPYIPSLQDEVNTAFSSPLMQQLFRDNHPPKK